MTTIDVPCAIRDCGKLAKSDIREAAFGNRFILCADCQMSVVLDAALSMEQNEITPMRTTYNFAVCYNEWMRKRGGATISHRSGVVTSVKDLDAPLIVGGN